MGMDSDIRVLIADDTALYRKILSMAVEKVDGTKVVATASDGILALETLKRQPADLVLLDVCMPRMDGLDALKEIGKLYPGVSVVMLSGVTTADADTTVEALQSGALEFIPKPKSRSIDESMEQLRQELVRIVRLVRVRRSVTAITSRSILFPPKEPPPEHRHVPLPEGRPPVFPSPGVPPSAPVAPVAPVAPRKVVSFDPDRSLVVIGVSTGGPNALNRLFSLMPKKIGCPILVVQHMPAFFTASLATFISKKTGLLVKEGADGEALRNDTVYIAPGGRHMVLEREGLGFNTTYRLRLNDDPPVNSCRPSVDVLFNSVAEHYQGGIISVIMTGMGEDGTAGVERIRRRGNCISLAQNEATCVVYGMPRSVAEKGLVDEVIPLDGIAPRISELLSQRKGN